MGDIIKRVERKILLNPGPATTTDSVKNAQIVPDICPREQEFGELVESISKDLIKIAGGDDDYTCVLIGGSGTAGMEAALSSAVNGKALIINNGAYGERFAKIADAYLIDYEELFFHWDEEINLEKIENALKSFNIQNIVMVHHETTTGILNPVKEVGELAKKYKCIFIVDAISSFAGIPFSIKDYNIDFMISTSNKCIQGMPGIVFVICKKSALENTKDNQRKSFYLNLYSQQEYFKKEGQFRFTPPVQTVYALRQAIDEFLEEGAENRYKRYRESYETLVDGMKRLGFKKIYDKIKESGILTTFWEPEDQNYSFKKMHDLLYEKGFTIYPGKIKEKTFRLANMGAINSDDIRSFLNAMKETIEEMNLNLDNLFK